ncbi:hypothetical protein ARMGADRAFT_1087678 [Armillaria gallica]|uniref:Uncharacterized protein n=1 Tax=Armillaria gallica TaxID=47427 RepID=A0A2H3DAC5_ARMGA|nr:hypothetical protein ARMGADRAFT_1087678 [Armillaria gallica]
MSAAYSLIRSRYLTDSLWSLFDSRIDNHLVFSKSRLSIPSSRRSMIISFVNWGGIIRCCTDFFILRWPFPVPEVSLDVIDYRLSLQARLSKDVQVPSLALHVNWTCSSIVVFGNLEGESSMSQEFLMVAGKGSERLCQVGFSYLSLSLGCFSIGC